MMIESIFSRNEAVAESLNRRLTDKGVYAVNVMGTPGAGKTSVVAELIKALNSPACVIEGDIESDIDTKRLTALGIKSYQLNTGGACHLDSPLIEKVIHEHPIENCFLFIENIGNLVCPAEFMIGEHMKLLISSVPEGSDKPYKYPLAFEKANAIILNKIDLLPYVDFDYDFFEKGVKALNKNVLIYKLSAVTGEGFSELAEMLSWKIKQ
jgi:hydrogenase nickel incorporation protein HypB